MYSLTEHEAALEAQAKSLAATTVAAHADRVDAESVFPEESLRALADAGLWGLTVPAEYGGKGGSLAASCAVVDAVAQYCPSTAMVYLMHLCGIAAYRANPQATGDLLREAAAGKHLSTLAWSESGSRSHFWAPVSQSQSLEGETVLNAKKSWVTSAGHADGYVVTTGTEGGGIDLFVVEKGATGFAESGKWDALGMRGNASGPMVLDNVRVSNDRRLSEPGQAFGMMMGAVLPQFALGNAAVSIGASEGAFRQTQSHLTGKGFEHLGTKLADLPNLRARLAQMRIGIDMARSHLGTTATKATRGDADAMLWVLSVKAMAADTALTVTDLGMKACGGAAFSRHLGVERFFRDARAMNVMAPTSDVLHDFVGKALCGMELF